jgi:hypothetical protein
VQNTAVVETSWRQALFKDAAQLATPPPVGSETRARIPTRSMDSIMQAPRLVALVAFLAGMILAAGRGAAPGQELPLVRLTNHWHFNQSGQDLSGQFSVVDYDDSAWPTGQGLLGVVTNSPNPYPHPILTPLTVGGGRITYYFRIHFHFPTTPDGVTLVSTNYVDDGAVYYLNGVEVGRLRIGPGAVTALTLAQPATPEGLATVLNLSAATLRKGDNVLAVEVHQDAATSGDVVFGLSLKAIPPADGPVKILIEPSNRVVEEGQPATFGSHLTGTPPYFFQWFKEGAPIAAATNQNYSIPAVTTNDAGGYFFIVSNAFSAATSTVARLSVRPASYELFPMTNVWRYHAAGQDLGAAWRNPDYDDTGWPRGAALFHNENAALPAPKNTPLPLTNAAEQLIVTYYFRTHFHWPGPTASAVLTARALLDDGAVLYLNGAEVMRVGMPAAPAPISYNTFANRTVGDAAADEVFSLPATALAEGDNVLAVEVHQADAAGTDVVFGLALGTNFSSSLPDLIIWGGSVNPRVEFRFFPTNHCEVLEGCATPGFRRLLRFTTETRNRGSADLFLGNPAGHPLFEFQPCHGHYHFIGFAQYRLLDLNGHQVSVGNKVGFCLEDLGRWDPAANSSFVYTCTNQGIQKGWTDFYSSFLPCQYVDVTGLPAGPYTLELEIDPDHKIPELDESNNVTRVTVVLTDPCVNPPPHDDFGAPEGVPFRIQSVLANNECATRQPGEPNHAGSSGGHSLWYQWTAPFSGAFSISTDGSSFDTALAVYRGANLTNLSLVAADDDSGLGNNSLVTFAGLGGVDYLIAVDGIGSATGEAMLNLNPLFNNNFASCLELTTASGSLGGMNIGATRELFEPNHAGHAGGASIWYCWRATNSGPVIFDTLGSRFDTVLAVYTNNSLSTIAPVASDDDSGGNGTSRVTFQAVAGLLYRIALDGADGASGYCQLNWRPALHFNSMSRRPDGSFQFKIVGAAGDHCVVETSRDLINWTLWLRLTNATGTIQLVDPEASARQRFYRAQLVP